MTALEKETWMAKAAYLNDQVNGLRVEGARIRKEYQEGKISTAEYVSATGANVKEVGRLMQEIARL